MEDSPAWKPVPAQAVRARSQSRYAAPNQAVVWFKCVAGTAHGTNTPNIAIVALANKLARMAWAVLTKNEAYRPPILADNTI